MVNKCDNAKLILIRHGESTYNEQNRFTGWKDVELTEKGIKEAYSASQLLENQKIDIAFTSNLKRAQDTLDIIMKNLSLDIPIIKNLALNERDYGDLVGQNKAEAAEKFGVKQVEIWRRSYDAPPPGGESLKMTSERTIPYFKEEIIPYLIDGKNVVVSAHGNSIRSIVMYILKMNKDNILKTEIGWCEPWCFDYNKKLSFYNLIIKSRPNSNAKSFLPKNINI